jgi:hypothetical protein
MTRSFSHQFPEWLERSSTLINQMSDSLGYILLRSIPTLQTTIFGIQRNGRGDRLTPIQLKESLEQNRTLHLIDPKQCANASGINSVEIFTISE